MYFNRSDRFGINHLRLVGILLILLGVVLLKTNFMGKAVTTVLWPVLEGSSEGKAVILLVMMGSPLLLSSFSTSNEWLKRRFFSENGLMEEIFVNFYTNYIFYMCGWFTY